MKIQKRPTSSHPYDQSAVIRARITMPIRPRARNPYDANFGKRTTAEKFVTGSCRRLGIDPHECLREVLRGLSDMKITEIQQVTSAAWAKAKKAAARSKKTA